MSEFDDLDSMFPDLPEQAESYTPDLEMTKNWASGAAFRQAPSAFTNVALVAGFESQRCSHCGATHRRFLNLYVRRIHHSRNSVTEHEAITYVAPSLASLPRRSMTVLNSTIPVCESCLDAQHYVPE